MGGMAPPAPPATLPPAPHEVIRVTSAEVAELLQQRETVLLLKRFMGEGRTVAAVAREAGLELHVVYRFARRMAALGVLEVVRLEQRAGRGMKVYRCPVRRFFIPEHLCSLEEFFWHEFEPVLQTIQRNLTRTIQEGPHGVKGVLVGDLYADNWIVSADANAVPWPSEEWGPTPEAPPVVALTHELHLDYEKAKAFNDELFELIERYRAEAGSGTYDLLLMLASRPK